MRTLCPGLRLLAACVVGMTALAQQPPPAQGNFRLTGTVVNSVTGDPIGRALVALPGQSVLTDGAGRFEFRNLSPMQGNIAVRKPGFFNEQQITQGQTDQTSWFETGPHAKSLRVKLTPEGIVFGRIESEVGPAERIAVKLMASRIREGRRHWEQQGVTNTDEDGNFRVANLMPGSYLLSMGPQWEPSAVVPGNPPHQRGYPQVFYPGVAEISAATLIEVEPGRQIEADLNARLVPMYRVSGSVSGVDPGQGISLPFTTPAGEATEFLVRFDDDTGNFLASVPAGSYVLKARGQTAEGLQVGADLPVDVNGPLQGVNVSLTPMVPIPVVVRTTNVRQSGVESNSPFTIQRAARPAPGSVTVSLYSTGMFPQQYYSTPEGTGKDQKLVFQNVEPGGYRADVQLLGGWYVSTLTCGNVDLLRDPLETHWGTRTPPIEVELRDDGATIQASLTSEVPNTQAWILLVSSRAPAQTQARATMANSTQSFADLAPGDYSILALDNIDGIEYKNPSVLEDYLGQATHVSLAPEQELELKLELVHRTK